MFICGAMSSVASTESASKVVSLTKESYEEFLRDTPLAMVEYYAPWCGHCKALAPEYEQAADALFPDDIRLAKVDCTAEADICNANGVQGYPTLKVFRDGQPSEYGKARKADDIVAYLRKQKLPSVSDVTSADLDAFKSKDKVVVVFFGPKSGDAWSAFENVANKMRDDFVFGVVASDVPTEYKSGSVVLFKQFDEGQNIFPDNLEEAATVLDAESLEKFVAINAVPLMNDIGPENYMKYVESGLPLAYLFVAQDEERANLAKVFEPLAKRHRGKLNFVYIDANQFGGHATNLNLKEQWPAFAIQEPKKQTKFPFDQATELSADAVTAFVDDYLAGKLKPSIKSAPIPESNDEPVKVVVADSFNDIVMDATKDVLIEFYATWCGHCKRLAPIYEQLATQLASVDSLVIAKMEATENDLPPEQPFAIEGFPTIKFFKANTNEMVDYNGERTVDGFIKFLKENAAIPFEVPEGAGDASADKKDDDNDGADDDKQQDKKDAEHDEL